MLESDWLTMTSTSVLIERASTAVDDYGVASFSTGVAYDCLWEPTRRMVARGDGQVVQAQATLFVLSTSARISVADQLVLPGTTERPPILSVDICYDPDGSGQHHLEVAVG